MSHLKSIYAFASFVAVVGIISRACSADEIKYPDLKGQWLPVNPGFGDSIIKFDPTKRAGPFQQAPLTPEYQKILENSMADQATGGLGNYLTARCIPGGMPRMMAAVRMEYVITPEVTYIIGNADDQLDLRRVYTDGRDWPKDGEVDPTFLGYSIGKWIDENGDGRYTMLEVETRGPFRGPRAYDNTGLPLHFDNQSTFKEQFFLDKSDPNLLHDEITVLDHALTRPWSVDKTFRRNPATRPKWSEASCNAGNAIIVIGTENYFLSADGLLMPAKKDQPPPDLRYFKRP